MKGSRFSEEHCSRRTTTQCARTARWGTGPPKNLPRPTAVEKAVASPPWKTLRVSHFSPAATTAALFRPLQWNQKPWERRYGLDQKWGAGHKL
jgi:hypothetical protein